MAVSARRRGAKRNTRVVAGEAVRTQIVTLPLSLDVTSARQLAASLLDLRGTHLAIDASQVQHLGAQCLQVLLAANMTWVEDGKNFVVRDGSSRFYEDLALLGIDPMMNLIGANGQ